MKKKKRSARQTRVNKSFMTNYLKSLFLLAFTAICFVLVSHHITLTEIKTAVLENPGNENMYLHVMEEQSLIFIKLMIGTMMCFFISVCIMTARLAKQVSHPVESLISHLDKFGHLSQVRKIRFEKGGPFEELLKSFNFLVQRQDMEEQKVAVHNYRSVLK